MNDNIQSIHKQSVQKDILQHFPRVPYPIQLNIANLLYETLNNQKNKLAIIQSPTGTGKTYSLLVPLIVWLKKNRTRVKQGEETQKKPSLPAWLKKPAQQKVQKIFSERKKRIQGAVSIAQAQKQLMKLRVKHAATSKQPSKQREQQQIQVQSEEEGNRHSFKRRLQTKIDMFVEKQLKVEDQNILPKIIFVSRTHSQLAQVIQSIKLITDGQDQIKYLQVASKQHLCINPAVNINKSNISQRCQYILDHSKCQFFHNLTIKQFFNTNIEDANHLGDTHHLCPYYATRNLIEQCDVICLPYASILSSDVRNRIGINIHNSIVVFDEGHNVIDNEKQLHSPQVYMEDVALLAQQIDEYCKKYQERLKISNYKLLIHFLEILRALIATMEKYRQERKKEVQQKKYLKAGYLQFISQMSIKQLKIFKLVKYIQINNIDQKLAYFNPNAGNQAPKSKNKMENIQQSRITVGKINNILRFFMQFASFDEQKQILLLKWSQIKKGCIKILCLQSYQLQKIVNKSRLTIVAGGTMQPLDDFTGLFEKFRQKVIVKKYPHIIKKQQCKVVILKKIGNRQIIFNHQTTNGQKQIQNLKKTCLKLLTNIIKKTEKGGGIVVFIQNYRLIQFFKDAFKGEEFYSRMLFDGKEPQQNGKKDIFQAYKKQVETDLTNNHILFSVMGGKLSQGINFSDRLARSLIVFGLPYANIYAPQVIQTINYIQNHKRSSKKEYLQSLCLRILNQTIGRGARHINDYVDIYLVDARFDGIKHKLSEWMKDRVTVVNDIEQL